MSLSSGSYIVSRATLVGLTGDCNRLLLLLLLLYFNVAVFSVKSKRFYSPQRMNPFSRTFTFCWINNRPCKHLWTAPSLVKIISFKYFRESSHLKQVKRAHFRCKVLPIAAPNRMNPQLLISSFLEIDFEINSSDKKSRRFDLSEVIFKCIKVLQITIN